MAVFRDLDTIQVTQRFGIFYVICIKAEDLLKVSFTDPLRYELGQLKGIQRSLDEVKRVKEIRDFVEGYDAAFPNSIIISANYDENGFNCEDLDLRWRIENKKLIIPTDTKLASVIDGQHRLFGFKDANNDAKKMELLVSVYLDLPNALQASLFATINSNQKPVDRSLAYEQFGFNIEKESPSAWPPDKFAIALYKKFNDEESSPFYNHIKIAPQIDDILREKLEDKNWLISTATIVDGIIRLISSNPKKDKNILQKLPPEERKRSALQTDHSPLRELYLHEEDIVIYKIIFNYFSAASNVLFASAAENSSIIKTVGIQGLFDALRKIIIADNIDKNLNSIDFTVNRFKQIFEKIKNIDFSNNLYQYSAVGKANISETILLLNGYVVTPEDPEEQTELAEKIRRKIKLHTDIKSLNM